MKFFSIRWITNISNYLIFIMFFEVMSEKEMESRSITNMMNWFLILNCSIVCLSCAITVTQPKKVTFVVTLSSSVWDFFFCSFSLFLVKFVNSVWWIEWGLSRTSWRRGLVNDVFARMETKFKWNKRNTSTYVGFISINADNKKAIKFVNIFLFVVVVLLLTYASGQN